MRFTLSMISLLGAAATASAASCPFMKAYELNKERRLQVSLSGSAGDGGIPEGGFAAVAEDIKNVLVDSQAFWPADFGNYGGLMIRLAWHCSGSYRQSDGRGGCDGARIRFDPELNWPDNANLDQALRLLDPIKQKYGSKLSWGDLIVLTGTTAIESMGGPSLGFCGGRIDNGDGTLSMALGPSDLQRQLAPCEKNGECKAPLGPTTIGLIYVNPAGPLGNPDQAGSAQDIRNSFGNMGFNERETVSLIGGGHAFGKTHGPCMSPPCGDGIGPNTFTSGFEGPWTTAPTTWTNEYFTNMVGFNWTLSQSPAGEPQWVPLNPDGSAGPAVIMLTADLALNVDAGYQVLVDEYSKNITSLEEDFAASWYRLTTQDMGPVSRCIGSKVPPVQPWQSPLPAAPATKPDYVPIRAKIQAKLDSGAINGTDLIRLAYQCADTFRNSDYRGGCNGARIRFPPQSEWPVNAGLDVVISKLKGIDRGDVSFADMIVLAGNTALENAGGKAMTFCGGRVDATNANFTSDLAPRDFISSEVARITDDFELKGLTTEQGIALYGRPTKNFPGFGDLFAALLTNQWTGPNAAGGFTAVNAAGVPDVTALQYALLQDAVFKSTMEDLKNNKDKMLMLIAEGWTILMNNDRFNGPTENACAGVDDATLAATPASASSKIAASAGLLLAGAAALL